MATPNKKREILVRIYIGFLLICLLGISIVFKAAYIQVYQGKELISKADSVTIFPRKVQAERGNIYSADGRLLATSLPIFDVHIDFNADGLTKEIFKKNIDSISYLLSTKFKSKSAADFKREFTSHHAKKDGYYLLCKNIGLTDLNEMKNWPWFRMSRNKSGLIIEAKERRDHPFGDLALRTLGSDEDLDGNYTSGLELKFNSILTGVEGVKLYRKLSGGASKPLDTKEDVAARAGQDVYTTIDINLQDVAQDALRRALTYHDADHGCVVLMEVKSGRIKAIANLGRKDSANYKELLNYAVGEATEPGSTFKLATIAALMEDGLVNKNTSVDCENGVKTFYNTTIKDHEAPETPYLTVQRAIEVSSNVAVAKLAFGNYASKTTQFYNHLKDFGFTQKVDIELPGAAKPVLAEPKNWSGVSCAFIAHGYEVQVSPLNTLQFYNAIANNGIMVKPSLVWKVREYNKTVDSSETKVLNQKVLSERTVKELREILEGVVERGTATNLKTDYLKIAGKTGTAVISNHGYKGNKKYQASFVGYFPAENPEFSMIVVVNSPNNGGYYGNVVAGKVFREVADKVYSLSIDMHKPVNVTMKGIQDVMPLVRSAAKEDIENIYSLLGVNLPATNDEWMTGTLQENKIGFKGLEFINGEVPNVVGMGLKDALYELESKGMKVEFTGKGNVTGQSINAGEKIIRGQKISIELS